MRQVRALSLLDLALVFAVADAGFAYFALSADGKPLPAILLPAVTLALVVSASLVRSEISAGRLLLLAALTIGAGFNLAFVFGHTASAPFHDSILLTDAAADRLIHGLDPYGNDYLNTAARFFYTPDVPVNFGIRHYVYPPGLILLDAPLRLWASRGGPSVGASLLYAPAEAMLALAAWRLHREVSAGAVGLVAVSLNTLMVADANIQFFNDVFFLAPLIGCVAAVQSGRPVLGGLLLGIAFCFKQQPVLLLPFLALLGGRSFSRGELVTAGLAASLLPLAISTPFLIWNGTAFAGDVAAFFYSSGVDNYPIRGLGLPGILYGIGIIPNRWSAFPSAPFQLVFTGGLILFWLSRLAKRWSWTGFWLAGATVSFSTFFFGRVLAPNYIDFTLVLATLAVALVVRPALSAWGLEAQPGKNLMPAGSVAGPHAGTGGGGEGGVSALHHTHDLGAPEHSRDTTAVLEKTGGGAHQAISGD